MKFEMQKPPHLLADTSVGDLMRRVLLALVPMLLVGTWFLGPGLLLNLVFACALCCLLEALMLRLRTRPVAPFLLDGSAVVTAALIALALPPLTPWWVTATACLFAIVFAKHLYGGLGYNLFNPAMAGYVAVLISFPQHVATWPLFDNSLSLTDTASFLFSGTLPGSATLDGISGATPLDSIRIQLGQMRTMAEIMAAPPFGELAGRGWQWINLAALAGGLWLLKTKTIRWQIPVAMLTALGGLQLIFFAFDPSTYASPTIALLSGGTMLGAFFIATDPVSGATSNSGRLIYGAGIGALTFTIRQWGGYPDGIAFAVLLMNMTAPLIDRYTLPRVYGERHRP
jgi:electron transport complex protein RnfD